MTAAELVLLAVVASAPLWALLLFVRRKRYLVADRLTRRLQLADAEFGETYFSGEPSRTVAIRLRSSLKRHLPFPLGGLHPDDRLFADLWLHQWNNESVTAFLDEVSEDLSITLDSKDLSRDMSFRTLVALIVERLRVERTVLQPIPQALVAAAQQGHEPDKAR